MYGELNNGFVVRFLAAVCAFSLEASGSAPSGPAVNL